MANPLAALSSVTPFGMAAGIVSGIVFKKWGRPLVVNTLKLGYEAKDMTTRAFDDARRMASEVRDEARGEATEAES